MEMICPSCRGTLVRVNEKTARCPLHGGEYEILFEREDPKPPPLPASVVANNAAGSAEEEVIPISPEICVAKPIQSGPPLPRCANHPDNDAAARCDGCGLAICETCVFDYPGLRLCPTCATKPPSLSSKKRNLMIAGYVLAAVPTALLALLFSGAFAETVDPVILGMMMVLLGYAPAVTGTCISFSAADRRTGTPASVWGAIVWNCIMLGILVLLSIVGMMSS